MIFERRWKMYYELKSACGFERKRKTEKTNQETLH
jgi:hypothetical protein